jgi:hypothetical protein
MDHLLNATAAKPLRRLALSQVTLFNLGYPVLDSKVTCRTCSKPANQEDWNKYIMIEKVINTHIEMPLVQKSPNTIFL